MVGMTGLFKIRNGPLIFFLLAVLGVCAEISFSVEGISMVEGVELHTCRDDQFGVRFSCNPDWEIEIHEGSVLLIISKDPAVTMTIAQTATPLVFISQINKKFLQEMGHYSDGFETEQVRLANQDAIKVKAFSREFSEVRLLDYYVLRGKVLYSILFSVNPKDEWDHYKFLIKRITDSFAFIN